MSDAWVVEAAYATDLDNMSEGGGYGEMIEAAHPMERGLNSLVASAKMLGLASDSSLETLQKLSAVCELTAVAYLTYRAVVEVVEALSGAEEALASVEAAVAAVDPLTWPNLALATAAAAGAFSAVEIASGQWTLPSFDMNSPTQRNAAADQLRSLSNG